VPQVRRERANISILLQSAGGRGFGLVLAFDFGYSTDNSPDVILHPCPLDMKTKSQQRPPAEPTGYDVSHLHQDK
jgi:hypothetical protein